MNAIETTIEHDAFPPRSGLWMVAAALALAALLSVPSACAIMVALSS